MRKILLALIVLLMVACSAPVSEKIEETYPDNHPKKISYYQLQEGKEVKVEEKYLHQNGSFKMGGKFVNGLREGKWTANFNNGQLQSTGTFINGKEEGPVSVYFPNGNLRYEGYYKNDKEAGHWKFYNEQGVLVDEKDY